MADLVYPGARHTRFEHSLGTLHTAGRILDTVVERGELANEDVATVRLAALLHDVGHGPFSHVSEYLLDQYYDYPDGAVGNREKIHERLTVDIISNEPAIAGLLTDEQREAVFNIIQGTRRRDAKRDVVSSDLDADKIDYLPRDSHYAGVKYGIFDLDKVIDSFTVIRRGEETFLAIDEAGIFTTEQLVLAKHHMTQQVYAHRVRVITDYMIVRGLELAIEDGLTEIKALYGYSSSLDYCQNYLRYSDDRVFDIVMNCDLDRPRQLFERLYLRNLFKELVRLRLTAQEIPDRVLRSRLVGLDANDKTNLEERIAEYLKCEPWEVVVEVKNIQNPAYSDPGSLNPEAILVLDKSGSTKSMDQYDELVAGKLPSFNTLHVIAPFEWPADAIEQQLRSAKADLQQEITTIVFESVGGSS